MYKRKFMSDVGENYTKRSTPEGDPSCGVSEDEKMHIEPLKRFKGEDDLPPASDATFSITEPTYDFKFLNSPCTVTSRSSLVPVSEDIEVASVVPSSSPEGSNKTASTSLELSPDTEPPTSVSDTVPQCSLSDASSDDLHSNSTPSSSSPPVLPFDHHRQLRKKRKVFTSEECPVCGVTVRHQDIKEHFECELRQLDYLKKKLKKPLKVSYMNKKLDQVKANRAKRTCTIGSRQMKDAMVSTCMVCRPELMDDEAAVHTRALLHLSECVGVRDELLEEALNEQSPVLEYRGILAFVDHVDSMSYNRIQNTEDEDSHVHVNVDSDEDDVYGSPQFGEQNLIVSSSNLSDSGLSALREAVLSSSDDDIIRPLDVPSPYIESETTTTTCEFSEGSDSDDIETRKSDTDKTHHSPSSAVIDALKSRVSDLEEQLQSKSASKCHICLDNYKNPLVSVNCWHVSCEECWMKTLGAKKLCAQCSKITLPTSLRKIYL